MMNLNPFTAQQTLHVNPTKEEREPTNAPVITLLFCIIFIWLFIIFKVISDDPQVEYFFALLFDPQFELQLHPRWSWEFPLGIVLSVLISLIYIYVLSQYAGRYIVYTGMFFLGCLVFLIPTVMVAIQRPFSFDWIPATYLRITLQIIFLLVIIAYLIMTIYCADSVEKEAIVEIIRDACRVLRCCPSISIFACSISLIIILILIFSIYMNILIVFDRNVEELVMMRQKNESIFNFVLFSQSYCATTFIYFFMNFTQIVISGYVMDWFWLKDPNIDSLKIRRSLGRVLNFHMGSVAFNSILPLPQIWSLYQVCRCRESDGDIVKRYNIYIRFFSQLRVFTNVIEFGMIQTSIYGYGSGTAIMAAHDLVAQNNHVFYMAVCGISDMVILFGLIITAIPFAFGTIFFCIYAVTIPFYILLATPLRTLLVNKMIINYTSDALKEGEDEKNSSVHPTTVL